MFFALFASALAVDFELGAGHELVSNDPFSNSLGMRGSAIVRPLPWLGVGVSAAGYPLHLKSTRIEIIQTIEVTPDISPIVATGSAFGSVRFARGPIGPIDGALDLVVGVGAVHTVDDCEALYLSDDRDCIATQRQFHPASVVGMAAMVSHGPWGLRVRGERWAYTEIIADQYDEKKIPVWVGAEAVFRLGKSP